MGLIYGENNYFIGLFLRYFWLNCLYLMYLFVLGNNFMGEILVFFVNCLFLQNVGVSWNKLMGVIFEVFSKSLKLMNLQVDYNKFIGSIFVSFCLNWFDMEIFYF